jgi:hypothetical protein
VVVPADRPGWHHRHPVRPGGAYELALIGHVQHRQRQPTAALQHRAFQRRLHRFGVGVVHVAGFVDTPQHALKGGERRQVDGVEAGAEQVGRQCRRPDRSRSPGTRETRRSRLRTVRTHAHLPAATLGGRRQESQTHPVGNPARRDTCRFGVPWARSYRRAPGNLTTCGGCVGGTDTNTVVHTTCPTRRAE